MIVRGGVGLLDINTLYLVWFNCRLYDNTKTIILGLLSVCFISLFLCEKPLIFLSILFLIKNENAQEESCIFIFLKGE